MQSSGNRDDHGEIGALGRVKVEEEVVGMLKIGIAAGPGIVVDATEAGQKQKGSAVIGGCVVNFFSSFFGIKRHGCEPLRYAFAQIFLKESLSLDSVRIAAQDQGSIAEKWQNEVRDTIVVCEHVPFGVAAFGQIDFVQVSYSAPFAPQLDRDGF